MFEPCVGYRRGGLASNLSELDRPGTDSVNPPELGIPQ